MSLRKSKIEILESIIHKQELDEAYWWMYYWDYEDDWYNYHDDYCDCYSCMPVDYEYLPDEMQPKSSTYISKRGIRITEHTWSTGKLIDMDTIYSKEELRQKRINHILGIESMYHTQTTLGDILNIKL
jgi:hypothetical protein